MSVKSRLDNPLADKLPNPQEPRPQQLVGLPPRIAGVPSVAQKPCGQGPRKHFEIMRAKFEFPAAQNQLLLGAIEHGENTQTVEKIGGADRDRTGGLLVANEAASHPERSLFNRLGACLFHYCSNKSSGSASVLPHKSHRAC